MEFLCAAGAFLKRDGHYLLMKRSPDKKIAPGVWSNVGGRMELQDKGDPLTACYREVFEETGIPAGRIYNLILRYIIIRKAGDIIRQNYVYFGETDMAEFIDTDEGTLHWVPEEELLNREYTQTFAAMMRHYLYTPVDDRVVVGVAENNAGSLHMSWAVVEDFEVIQKRQKYTNLMKKAAHDETLIKRTMDTQRDFTMVDNEEEV